MNARVRDSNPAHLPSLYRVADEASRESQKWYLVWARANLSVLVLGSIVGAIQQQTVAPTARTLAYVSAGFFFLGVSISLLLAFLRLERTWYAGRAVAESVKSLAWKYQTGAEPFHSDLLPKDAADSFLSAIKELLRDYREYSPDFARPEALEDLITREMAGVRSAAWQVRRDLYLSQRVGEQQSWYTAKAAHNRNSQRAWFAAFIGAQVLACVAAFVGAAGGPAQNWVGVFGGLASAVVAWGQIKRFQDLAQAYGYAAQELSLITEKGKFISTGDELARFVADAETAISREHTAWVARRETR